MMSPFLVESANFLCRSFDGCILDFQSCLRWDTGIELKGAVLETTAISWGECGPGGPLMVIVSYQTNSLLNLT